MILPHNGRGDHGYLARITQIHLNEEIYLADIQIQNPSQINPILEGQNAKLRINYTALRKLYDEHYKERMPNKPYISQEIQIPSGVIERRIKELKEDRKKMSKVERIADQILSTIDLNKDKDED